MQSVVVEDLRNGSKRLVELRRHLDKVASHGSTAQTVVIAVGEDAMEGMTELMEERRHLIPSEQRRFAFGCFRIVAHVEDDWHLVVAATLLSKAIHPRTAALRWATIIVGIEECLLLAVLVEHLEHLHVGMISRDVGALLETESVSAVGCIEHAVDEDTVDVEVRLHLVVTDIEQLVLHLCRIVETVVRLQLEVLTFRLTSEILDCLSFRIRLRLILCNEAFQKSIDIFRGLCHCLLQRIGSIVRITHKFCLLGTQLGNLAHNGVGVELTSAVGTVDGSLIHLSAQVAVLETGEQRLLRGIDDDDSVRSLTAKTLGILLALLHVGSTQSREFLLAIHPHHGFVGSFGQQVAPLLLQVGDAQVDCLHALFLIVRQQSTLAHKLLVSLLQEFLVLALERVMLSVIHLSDAFEERHVE